MREFKNAALDALSICMFTHSYTPDMLLPEDYAQLLAAATGEEITGGKLLLLGERLHALEKSFNFLHTGWTKKDDLPPKRFVEVPLAGIYRIDLTEGNSIW